ncbi:MAG: arsenite methyltransferase [Bacteroidota bacterium]
MKSNANSEAQAIKEVVKAKYAAIAQSQGEEDCGCGPTCCSPSDLGEVSEEVAKAGAAEIEMAAPLVAGYEKMEGYLAESDLGLGCGLPTQFAQLKPGDTVLDLGSGAGNDCFIARAQVGAEGKVIGVDMTPEMINKARKNAEKAGFENVEFMLGEIEALPLSEGIIDVVVSNCVMNLVPDKEKAFAETYRVLKSGGHFSISDIVVEGSPPESLRKDMELYVGCVSGALEINAYLKTIEDQGFQNLQIQKKRKIELPQALKERYPSSEEYGIYSITVFAQK